MSAVETATSLEAAVDRADEIARELLAGGAAAGSAGPTGPATAPATVLLSPAAASFDMFVDYAARGRAFRAAAAAIAERRRAGDPA
jgi:UDP-N-acetylmuramoylalanine--D-glutamate ligase